MDVIIRRKTDFDGSNYFEAYPVGEPEIAIYGKSADALYETIESEIEILRMLKDKDVD